MDIRAFLPKHLLSGSRLAKWLIFHVLGVLAGITLLMGTFLFYREYRVETQELSRAFSQIQKVNLESIEENLWILDIDSLRILLKGLLRKRDFVYFKVSDERGKVLAEEGVFPQKDFVVRTVPLYHLDAYGAKVRTGELTMVATTKYIWSHIFKEAYFALILLVVTLFFEAVFIVYLVWFLISRHLEKIQRYTRDITLNHQQEPLTLDRVKKHRNRQGDELDALVDAINRMRYQIQESYSHIEYQSMHDSLTGLANRWALKQQLSRRIRDGRESGRFAALMFVDLDLFKVLNDSLGHAIGDHILVELAKRLRRFEKKGHFVFRIGGDEFVVLTGLLSENPDKARQSTRRLAEEIQAVIKRSIAIEARSFRVTASIGIELFRDIQDISVILKHADNAMYRAKSMGRNTIVFFREQMQLNADKRLEFEQRLRQALQEDSFVILFQPKYDRDKRPRSAEVLIRLRRADGTLTPPEEFIPIAEETGMILGIDHLVIRRVFQFIAENRTCIDGSELESIAINISPLQFTITGFTRFIISEAEKYGIEPNFIILEITEEAVVSNIKRAIETMHELKEYGFRFSIDDFGTGYSSMHNLISFPLDELKIDKSFVKYVLESDRNIAIIKSIIAMAHNLHLHVVAEGVEHSEQFKMLVESGCELFQGYFLAYPQLEEDFLIMLQRENTAK